jgi:hypothetical protein
MSQKNLNNTLTAEQLEQRRERNRQRYERVKNDPAFKEERAKKLALKNQDSAWKAKQVECKRKSYEKHRETSKPPTPTLEQQEKTKERKRQRYEEVKNDPAWKEEQAKQMAIRKAAPDWKAKRAEIGQRWREKQRVRKEQEPEYAQYLHDEYKRYARQEQARDPTNYAERHKIYKFKFKAKTRGIELKLSHEEILALFSQDCHYCGRSAKGGKLNGIDRKDSNGIYEPHNIVPACYPCNTAKGVMTYNAFVAKMANAQQLSSSSDSTSQ